MERSEDIFICARACVSSSGEIGVLPFDFCYRPFVSFQYSFSVLRIYLGVGGSIVLAFLMMMTVSLAFLLLPLFLVLLLFLLLSGFFLVLLFF